MIDSTEEEMSRGVVWGRVVINRFKTIFAHKNRATGEVKLKCLAKRVLKTVLIKRVLNTVLRISVRRGKVLNALEGVACHQGKSRRPMISKRKNIHCVEEGKPTREVMSEGQSYVSGSLVLARHIEILAKASDPHHKKLCPFPRAIVS